MAQPLGERGQDRPVGTRRAGAGRGRRIGPDPSLGIHPGSSGFGERGGRQDDIGPLGVPAPVRVLADEERRLPVPELRERPGEIESFERARVESGPDRLEAGPGRGLTKRAASSWTPRSFALRASGKSRAPMSRAMFQSQASVSGPEGPVTAAASKRMAAGLPE